MLKHYTVISELARDIRTINRATRVVLVEDLKLAKTIAADSDTISIRGKNADMSVNSKPPAKKLSAKKGKELNQKSADLDKLMQHQLEIANIINILNNEFSSDEYPEKDKMIVIAKRLATNIAEKITTLKASIVNDAKNTLPPLLGQVANILHKKLTKEMTPICATQSSTVLTAQINDAIQHTIYYIYNNVQDDAGQITPQVVFGLTYYSDHIYINPSLHSVLVPGKFKLGTVLNSKSNSPTDLANQALKEINNQLASDSMLTAVTGNPVPFGKKKLDTLKQANIKMTFIPEVDSLTVTINQKMADPVVQELINKLTVELNTMIKTDKSLPKMVIRYTKQKKQAPKPGWIITYKFLPSGKYSGKTLDQQDLDHLRQHFNEEESQKMLMALTK